MVILTVTVSLSYDNTTNKDNIYSSLMIATEYFDTRDNRSNVTKLYEIVWKTSLFIYSSPILVKMSKDVSLFCSYVP